MNKQIPRLCRKFLAPLFITAAVSLIFGQGYASDFLKKEPIAVKETYEKGEKAVKDNHAKGIVKKAKEQPAPAASTHPATSTHDEAIAAGAEEGLKRLTDGNKRYVAGGMIHKRQNAVRRTELAKGQHPFAVILSCSDSRVPPEIIFDQGLGDLFVVRTAGHVADDIAIASIEYAVEHLGVRLVLVLGHERCGAVTAAVNGGEAPGQIGKLVEAIKPAVEKAKAKVKHGDLLDEAVKANVKIVAEKLRSAKPILSEIADDGVLKIVGGYYDLDTGAVLITYKPCM